MMKGPFSKCSRLLIERALGIFVVLCSLLFISARAQSQTPDLSVDCENRNGCVSESRSYQQPSETVFSAAVRAIDRLTPASVEIGEDRAHLSAVFRVFLFRDDVDVLVDGNGEEANIYVRSASRFERLDIGANARRVTSFFRYLERFLDETNNQR
jgi:uncharacterized protein (DUF1499 family)